MAVAILLHPQFHEAGARSAKRLHHVGPVRDADSRELVLRTDRIASASLLVATHMADLVHASGSPCRECTSPAYSSGTPSVLSSIVGTGPTISPACTPATIGASSTGDHVDTRELTACVRSTPARGLSRPGPIVLRTVRR